MVARVRRTSAAVVRVAIAIAIALLAGTAWCAIGAGGEWERFPQLGVEDFISNVVTAVVRDSAGRLWVGTDRGLVWTSDSGRTWNVVNLAFAQPRPGTRRRTADGEDSPAARPITPDGMLRRNTVTCLAAGRNGIWVGTLDGLCFGNEDMRSWDLFLTDRGPASGAAVWGVAEHMGEVWASAASGIYRSPNLGGQWQKIDGNFPARIRSVTLGEVSGARACWLSGFDAPSRYGGGPDILRSVDGGKSWRAQKTGTASDVARPVSARTHRIVKEGRTLWAATRHGLAYSMDGGENWLHAKARSGLDAEEVFDVASIGTDLWAATSEGLYTSSDGGQSWKHDGYVRCPMSRIAPDERALWAATNGGLLQRTRTTEWRTFSVRSNVLSMAVTGERGAETCWLGTTGGLVYSRDSGKNWRALTVADGLPSNSILSLAADGDRVWAGTDGGVWVGAEGGEGARRYARQHGLHGLLIHALRVDGGSVWAGTNRGLSVLRPRTPEWRTMQVTKDWQCLCVVGETVYGAVTDVTDPSGAVSLIAGSPAQDKWRTLYVPAHQGRPVNQIAAVGDDVWVASDAGLFRTRDGGESWARFGTESLWASRAIGLLKCGTNTLCVPVMPDDPPSPMTYVNVSRDGGRSWSVLPAAIWGRANVLITCGDRLLVGTSQAVVGSNLTRGGVALYTGFEHDLRPGRTGWWTWNRAAGLAASTFRPDQLGRVSALDRYAFHGPTVWLGSNGMGAVERGVPILDEVLRTWEPGGVAAVDTAAFAALPGEDVLCMADSPEGMWFGTGTGLFLYNRLNQWTMWRPAPDGLIAAPVRAVVAAGPDVWVGTDEGLGVLNRPTGRWRRCVEGESPLPNNHVTVLAYDGERLWGGTRNGGFFVDADGNWKPCLPEEKITDIAISSDREYYATDRGVFGLNREGQQRTHFKDRTNSALPDNNVQRVFVDGPELWAATPKGVSKISHDRSEPPTMIDVEPSLRGPEGVLVVVNDNSENSRRIGEEYRALRNIPPVNICHIRCGIDETIRRDDFVRDIQMPLWRYLRDHDLSRQISFIVTTYGVPLRIAPEGDILRATAADRSEASVDSELTLLARAHPLRGSIPNPYLHRDEPFNANLFGLYLVTRLDGPTADSAVTLARDAVAAETERTFGTRGFARFDLHPVEEELGDRLNNAILGNYHSLARQERLHGRVVPPERTLLPFFRPGSALNTFFFLGWGNHDYHPEVFSWVQGAIGINLDPVTAPSLHDVNASWVAAVIDARVCATLGNVYDPGPNGIASVADLHRHIKAGFTWAEIAYMAVPQLSWQTVVIGDPLYAPAK